MGKYERSQKMVKERRDRVAQFWFWCHQWSYINDSFCPKQDSNKRSLSLSLSLSWRLFLQNPIETWKKEWLPRIRRRRRRKQWPINSLTSRSPNSRRPSACSTRMATVRIALSLYHNFVFYVSFYLISAWEIYWDLCYSFCDFGFTSWCYVDWEVN